MKKTTKIVLISSIVATLSVLLLALHFGKQNVPKKDILSQRYSISWQKGTNQSAVERQNLAMWQLANRLFVKSVPKYSTPTEVHVVLGKPIRQLNSADAIRALRYEDELSAERETFDNPEASNYPWKDTWKIEEPDFKNNANQMIGEIYKIKIKANGEDIYRYWHIYYLNDKAVYQSYTMWIDRENYQDYIGLETD